MSDDPQAPVAPPQSAASGAAASDGAPPQDTPPADQPPAGLAPAGQPPAASAARRRVYQSEAYTHFGLAPPADGSVPAGSSQPAAVSFWGAVYESARASRATRLSRAWPLQVALAVPLACGAAVSAGLAIYLGAVAAGGGDSGLSTLPMAGTALAALAVCVLCVLGWTAGLRAEQRSELDLGALIAAACGGVAAAVLAVLDVALVPALVSAFTLAWVVLVTGLRRFAFPDAPAPTGHVFAGPGLAAGVAAAVIAMVAALAAGFAAFSLAVVSFVSGQSEFGWQTTLFNRALDRATGSAVVHVATLMFANLGIGALFALLLYGGARALGLWRGPLFVRWAIVLGVLVIAGAVAWIVDPAIPRFW